MTDKPIIIPTIRIPALRGGRMTQMRVPLDPQPKAVNFNGILLDENVALFDHGLGYVTIRDGEKIPLPYSIGDRLWVAEEWRCHLACDDLRPSEVLRFPLWYESDRGLPAYQSRVDYGKLRSPVTMPRWASRTTLVVNDVRVQRVQEISEADAIVEGCRPFFDEENPEVYVGPNGTEHEMAPLRGPVAAYEKLWNTIHGPDAWGRNDWVSVPTFDVHLCNIDQMPGDV